MKHDTTEEAHLDLADVSQRIDEAREKVLLQQRIIEHAARIGLSVHEEKGWLMIIGARTTAGTCLDCSPGPATSRPSISQNERPLYLRQQTVEADAIQQIGGLNVGCRRTTGKRRRGNKIKKTPWRYPAVIAPSDMTCRLKRKRH